MALIRTERLGKCANCRVEVNTKSNNSYCKFCAYQFCEACMNPNYERICYMCCPYTISLVICIECNEFLSIYDVFNIKFCGYCDSIVCKKCITNDKKHYLISKCITCYNNNITRDKLPDLKAKKIISIFYIDDIASIIFDYYYIPRRYAIREM